MTRLNGANPDLFGRDLLRQLCTCMSYPMDKLSALKFTNYGYQSLALARQQSCIPYCIMKLVYVLYSTTPPQPTPTLMRWGHHLQRNSTITDFPRGAWVCSKLLENRSNRILPFRIDFPALNYGHYILTFYQLSLSVNNCRHYGLHIVENCRQG